MPRRRESILGFDRLTGIEIADLADRLMEIWPDGRDDRDQIAQAREHLDALDQRIEQITRTAGELRAELDRIAGA